LRSYPSAIAAHLAARKGLLIHALLWLSVRDRATNARETIGLWTGVDAQVVTVGGVARTYYGVGSLLSIEPLVTRARLEERSWSVAVSPLNAQVIEAIRAYDARLAPAELHLWFLDPLTHEPLAEPVREFRGTVMEVDAPTPAMGGEATATISMVSDAWRLTKGLTLRRSDGALRARTGGVDGFRKYNTTPDSVEVAWGETLKTVAGALPTSTPSPAVPGASGFGERSQGDRG
jgi:hypothetical protein